MASLKVRLLAASTALTLLLPTLTLATHAQSTSQNFPATGKTISGRFLDYWNTHGGLAQQGYPISDQMQAVSLTDGKTYTTQYFERAVFEMHPENAAPNDVLLTLLGDFWYQRKYGFNGAPGQKADTAANAQKVAQTGHTLGGTFMDYYNAHGGLAQFGYPISDEFTEISSLNNKPYTVQYFERAVMELHPENQAPYNVLLSQLGTYEYQSRSDMSYTDWTGTKRTLTSSPKKIVCLTGECEDVLFELGLEPAAVNDTLYQQPQFYGPNKTIPAIGGSFGAPNLEDIAKIQPDLVVGFQNLAGQRDAIEKIAPFFVINPSKYQDTIDFLRVMGRLTGRNYQAEQAVQKFYAKIAAYKAKSPNNRVPLILFGNSAAFSIFTQGSLFGSVLSEATNYPWAPPGPGQQGSADQEPGSLQYSLEQILAKDPDVLLIITQGKPTPTLSSILAANPVWSQLKAVKNNHAYEVNFSNYVTGRGLVSLGIALDDAMMKIYPETFTKPLP